MARRIGSGSVGHAAMIFSSSGGVAAPVAAPESVEFPDVTDLKGVTEIWHRFAKAASG